MVPSGGSIPPTAPIPFIKATFTHNFFLRTRDGRRRYKAERGGSAFPI